MNGLGTEADNTSSTLSGNGRIIIILALLRSLYYKGYRFNLAAVNSDEGEKYLLCVWKGEEEYFLTTGRNFFELQQNLLQWWEKKDVSGVHQTL